eukprot:3765425-Pyramimonas_sp.AAC.1
MNSLELWPSFVALLQRFQCFILLLNLVLLLVFVDHERLYLVLDLAWRPEVARPMVRWMKSLDL